MQNTTPQRACLGLTDVFFLIASAFALSVEVFLRSGIGNRYLGPKGLMAIFIMLCFISLWPIEQIEPMVWFLVLYIVLTIIARLAAIRRSFRGDMNHSRYSGWPRLLRRGSTFSEITVKKYVEPAFVIGVALLIGNQCQPLCIYLLAASFCLFFCAHQSDMWTRSRAVDMNDAVVEQQQIAERFRYMRRDQF